ncbi:MAG: hypothetical protein OXH76_01675, partial [Boseongicola sp.]|nr:hypothetical protein [Boseongicola sp.]
MGLVSREISLWSRVENVELNILDATPRKRRGHGGHRLVCRSSLPLGAEGPDDAGLLEDAPRLGVAGTV